MYFHKQGSRLPFATLTTSIDFATRLLHSYLPTDNNPFGPLEVDDDPQDDGPQDDPNNLPNLNHLPTITTNNDTPPADTAHNHILPAATATAATATVATTTAASA